MTNGEPAVSVVIPVYNAEKYIAATVNSITGQTVKNIEIIVVDDCSKDSSAEIVKRLADADPRVRYLRMPANTGGPAGPRNTGVAAARAPWIALCDSDDLWDPGKLELQLKCADAAPADFVCAPVVVFADGTTPVRAPATDEASRHFKPISLIAMLIKNQVATSSVLCRKALIEKAGWFDTDRALVAVEDYDLWLRMLSGGSHKLVKMAVPLVDYRNLATSLSRNKLSQLIKILNVHKRHFTRSGMAPMYYVASPVLIALYAVTWGWGRLAPRFARGS
jgi:glycosyltransferase involved in cell wall biosynthesis